MSFKPVNYDEGRCVLIPVANSVAVVRWGAMADNGSGLLDLATSSTAIDIEYIAAETVTTTSSGQLVRMYPTRGGVRFVADVDAAAAQTDVGTLADLASGTTINPDASTHDLFFIESIDLSGGAVGTSTRVFGYFNHANES